MGFYRIFICWAEHSVVAEQYSLEIQGVMISAFVAPSVNFCDSRQ